MNYWRLLSTEELSYPVVIGVHNHVVCLLAVLFAIMAAWALLPTIDRFHAGNSRYRYYWLGAGSIAMGTGIWAMHFCSMLAYQVPFPIQYDPDITLISILPAVLASGLCVLLSNLENKSQLRLQIAALVLALGIGVMHYLGMEAIIVPAEMYYKPSYFFFSLVAAYLLSLVGLSIRFRLADAKKISPTLKTLIGSVILGLAVSAMHFIGMKATFFQVTTSSVLPDSQPVPYGLIIVIAVIAILLPSMIVLCALIDKRMSFMANSLEQSKRFFLQLAETTQTAIFTFNEANISYVNPALSQILGYDQRSITELSLKDIFSEKFSEFAQEVLRFSSIYGKAFYNQFEILDVKGNPHWLHFSVTVTDVDGEVCGLASAIDISEQKKAEFDMRKLAYSDQLTKLANRALFIDRLQHHLYKLKRGTVKPCSYVLSMDINDFKGINDSYGHQIGDSVLVEIAARMTKLIRQTDTLARLGGDEFIMLIEDIDSYISVAEITERILKTFTKFTDQEGRSIDLSASIGLLQLTEAYNSPDQVLHDVDIALYRAKQSNEFKWVIFDEKLDADSKRAKLLQAELKVAIKEGKLQLHYQPIVDARSHEIEGFEALARWQRDNGEWVSPVEFIPLAEKNGMVSDLGLWALDTAAKQLEMLNQSSNNKQLYISVNTASVCFNDERLYQKINAIFHGYQFQKGQLKLELTESTLMKDSSIMLDKLNSIIDMGCELMIDDFGTGFSSLSYLHLFPVCAMKIDRSFVNNLFEKVSTTDTVKTIISLAKSLNINVVSEGVETEQQSRLLAELGSNQLQGYLFSKPVPQQQAIELIKNNITLKV